MLWYKENILETFHHFEVFIRKTVQLNLMCLSCFIDKFYLKCRIRGTTFEDLVLVVNFLFPARCGSLLTARLLEVALDSISGGCKAI